MKYRYIIALDPSGNFEEGKGTTGFSLFSCDKKEIIFTRITIKASDYKSKEDYWHAHINILKESLQLYIRML